MDFYKYQVLGNDYIVINPSEFKRRLTPARIRLVCNRNFGLGACGILYGPIFEKGKIKLRIFNSDGSEAEKSGNGIRIFAKYLYDAKIISPATLDFKLETLSGEVAVKILNNDATLIAVDMGTVTFQSEKIPVKGKKREVINEPLKINDKEYKITCLSIGNPHCIIPLNKISKELLLEIGPKIEHHQLFPNRVNVQLLKVIDRKNIRIEIWERGVGYTLASGSSSCAAVGAANRLGLVDKKVKVFMPGGAMTVEIKENNHFFLIGPVSKIASGNFANEFWTGLKD
ncbi:MAG: diaminopimelate epimerase [candidate division WOR-3 bacterium]